MLWVLVSWRAKRDRIRIHIIFVHPWMKPDQRAADVMTPKGAVLQHVIRRVRPNFEYGLPGDFCSIGCWLAGLFHFTFRCITGKLDKYQSLFVLRILTTQSSSYSSSHNCTCRTDARSSEVSFITSRLRSSITRPAYRRIGLYIYIVIDQSTKSI